MQCLQDVNNMNSQYPSLRLFRVRNYRTDLDEIWYWTPAAKFISPILF
jgi:hypothetical protein